MSLTEALARPVLKRKFDKGAMPVAILNNFPALAAVPNDTDLDGDDLQQALQNGTPQAAGSTYGGAADNFQPGVYNRFLVTRVSHYSLCRIQGPVIEAAKKKGDGAFANLVDSETDGAATTEMKCEETYLFGDGSGVKGRIATTATVSSVTCALATGEDIIRFDLGEKLDVYDGATVSTMAKLTVIGDNRITGISRDPTAPNLTLGAAWSATFSGISAASAYVTRASDGPSAGVARVITGLTEWIRGGTAPAALFSCTRSTDPVLLAGQTADYTGIGMEEALNDAESRLGFIGDMQGACASSIRARTSCSRTARPARWCSIVCSRRTRRWASTS